MQSILIFFHCESNTGFAIGALERVFLQMALELTDGDWSRVHFGYPGMARGPSPGLPAQFSNYLVIDTADRTETHARTVRDYLQAHSIDTVFGFDQPATMPLYRHLRAAGVRTFVSYWGAPMSSVFGPLKRMVKRLEMSFRRHGPDHYIFESNGMADTAILGRGISKRRVSVVPLGVDPQEYRPDLEDSSYAYDAFGIPKNRRIFFFSGHMESRKGVHVILRAARMLHEQGRRHDWHFLLLGNLPGDKERLLGEVGGRYASEHVTFGGYRSDVARIHRSCFAGIIASTGWDSLTMSSVEMQSSGLPLIVSDLQGLRESIEAGKTGFLFPAGDSAALAERICELLDDHETRDRLSANARLRVEQNFSVAIQKSRLVALMRARDLHTANIQPDT